MCREIGQLQRTASSVDMIRDAPLVVGALVLAISQRERREGAIFHTCHVTRTACGVLTENSRNATLTPTLESGAVSLVSR